MTKRAVEPIQKGPVRLRLLAEADLPKTLAWRNRDEIRRWFIYSDPLTPDQHQGWYERYRSRDDDFVFIIEEVEELGKPVGQVSLYDVNWAAKKAEFGRLMIGEEDARGKGLAKKATVLILEFGFRTLGLDEIYLEVFEDNTSAYQLYRSLGFQTVGQHDRLVKMSLPRPADV